MSLTKAVLLVVELIQAISCDRIDESESPFVDLGPFSTCEKQQKVPSISPLARPAGCSRRVLQPKCACVRGRSDEWRWKRRTLTPSTVDLRTSRVVRVSTQDRGAIGADRRDLMSRYRDSVHRDPLPGPSSLLGSLPLLVGHGGTRQLTRLRFARDVYHRRVSVPR